MNEIDLNEIPAPVIKKESTYIPPFIQAQTDEQYCRAELARYYNGDTLERRVRATLDFFRGIKLDIKEHDFCEENWTNKNSLFEIRLVWKRRLRLQ